MKGIEIFYLMITGILWIFMLQHLYYRYQEHILRADRPRILYVFGIIALIFWMCAIWIDGGTIYYAVFWISFCIHFFLLPAGISVDYIYSNGMRTSWMKFHQAAVVEESAYVCMIMEHHKLYFKHESKDLLREKLEAVKDKHHIEIHMDVLYK